MPGIESLRELSHQGLQGVRIFPLSPVVASGIPQEVLVSVDPFCEIPLHTHEVDATMIIVSGRAEVLSADLSMNGAVVGEGVVVFFERQIAHGFRASEQGFSFISRNGGIVDESEGGWDIEFVAHQRGA